MYVYICVYINIYHIQLAVKSSKISHLTDKRIGPGVEFTTAEAPAGDEGRPDKAAADDEQAAVRAATGLALLRAKSAAMRADGWVSWSLGVLLHAD